MILNNGTVDIAGCRWMLVTEQMLVMVSCRQWMDTSIYMVDDHQLIMVN